MPHNSHALDRGSDPLLRVSGLSFDYGGAIAVSDLSFEMPGGSIAALIGSNGAGKSTTVKIIAGALRARRGQIMFDGQDVTRTPAHQVVNLGLALVPEGRLVFQHLTVLENLQIAGNCMRAKPHIKANLDRMFDLFPRLQERRHQTGGSMSGGEQQMLAIARGLMTMPKLLILDEPSLGLSPKFVANVFDMIRALNNDGISILLVEQNVHQTLSLSDTGHVLEKGRIVRSGTGQELLLDPSVKASYLGTAD